MTGKRRGAKALGVEMVHRLSDYERWTAAFDFLLFEKSVLTPTGFVEKRKEIEARWSVVQLPADVAAT